MLFKSKVKRKNVKPSVRYLQTLHYVDYVFNVKKKCFQNVNALFMHLIRQDCDPRYKHRLSPKLHSTHNDLHTVFAKNNWNEFFITTPGMQIDATRIQGSTFAMKHCLSTATDQIFVSESASLNEILTKQKYCLQARRLTLSPVSVFQIKLRGLFCSFIEIIDFRYYLLSGLFLSAALQTLHVYFSCNKKTHNQKVKDAC